MACVRETCLHVKEDHQDPDPHEDPHPCHVPGCICPTYRYDIQAGESAEAFQGGGGGFGGGGASGSW